MRLGRPAAVSAGAGWRVHGDTVYSSASTYTRSITSSDNFYVEFKPIPGWNLPAFQSVFVSPGALIAPTATYTADPLQPPLSITRSNGLVCISWPATSTLRPQEKTNLNSLAWLDSTNTITTNESFQT